MITPQLIEYIKTQTKLGYTKEVLAPMMLAQGWSQSDIDAAFTTAVSSPEIPAASTIQSTSTVTTSSTATPADLQSAVAGPMSEIQPIRAMQVQQVQSEKIRTGKSKAPLLIAIIAIVLAIIAAGVYVYLQISPSLSNTSAATIPAPVSNVPAVTSVTPVASTTPIQTATTTVATTTTSTATTSATLATSTATSTKK